MRAPRTAAIHDLSGLGRCSLTIVIPTLSAMGVQCCPLPTAYLSTHTGGFTGNTFLDMTHQMASVTAHWRDCGAVFDAIYTGFMGSEEQISLTADFIRTFRRQDCPIIVDPVMGDHGKAYRTYTQEMCRAMLRLTELASIITPNRTEAALLLNREYDTIDLSTPASSCRWAEALSGGGRRSVVLTGVTKTGDKPLTGAACFDHTTGETYLVYAPLVPGQYHGTGDLFASVLTGALVLQYSLKDAAQLAADFTSRCAARTKQEGVPSREGLDFEPLLSGIFSQTR